MNENTSMNAVASKQSISQTPFDLTIRRDLQWDFCNVEVKFVDHPSMMVSFLWAVF